MSDAMVHKLKAKVDQLWQIAAHDACGRNVQAVAHLYHDIQKLFKTINESEDHASEISQATEVHGNVRPCEEPACRVS